MELVNRRTLFNWNVFWGIALIIIFTAITSLPIYLRLISEASVEDHEYISKGVIDFPELQKELDSCLEDEYISEYEARKFKELINKKYKHREIQRARDKIKENENANF